MVVVDSSVWIDFFRATAETGVDALERRLLRQLLAEGEAELVVPDLVLFEVLRGFRLEKDFRQARRLLESLTVEATGSPALAVAAAGHDRALKAAGFTVRSSIDVLLASFCIENDYTLLHRDRDFDAFETLRGLRVLHDH